MQRLIIYMGILSFLSSCFVGKTKRIDTALTDSSAKSIYDIQIKTLDGKGVIKLSEFKGKYVVIVNTASACGFTPQYKDLQAFHTQYKDSNIVVIGCPCNQFGNQESGTAAEIGSFCEKNYGVTFPITEKINVKGEGQHPLYAWLTQKTNNGASDFEVKWNFNKFIINPQGQLTYYFGSMVKPSDAEFKKAVNIH
jgi:glutathione peroxidase